MDSAEEIINIRFQGLQDAPRLFDDAVVGVKKLTQSLEALQKSQGTLQKQYNAASPQQQPQLEKQLNKVAYQIDQATTSREQAAGYADSQYSKLQQYNDLARRIQAVEQKRTSTPPPPGPRANLSPEVAQAYDDKQSALADAQGKFKRARSDTSKSKLAEEINGLQGELERLVEEVVRVAYEKPIDEVRRRVEALQQKAGRSATNAEFMQAEKEVAQGRAVTPEEDESVTKRRSEVMNPKNAAQRFAGKFSRHAIMENLTEGGGLNVGYAAMQLGEEYSAAAAATMAGQRVTPEAQNRAMYGMLPGAGALVGSAFGWTGSLVGGGVGSAAQGMLSATSEKDEHVRLASEEISTSLGRGAAAGRQFAAILESSARQFGTPIAELSAAMTQIAHSVGGLNMQGATGLQAYLQSQMGDNYAATVGAQAKATTAPFAQDYRDMLAGKTPASGAAYNGMADYYDAVGDRATADQLRGVGAALGTSPRIADLQAKINFTRANHPSTMGKYADFWLGSHRTEIDAQGKKHDVVETVYDQRIHNWQAEIDRQNGQDADSLAASPDKAAGDALADAMQQGKDTQSFGQSSAASFGAYAQQALRRGRGVAGMRQFEGGQVSGLTNAQSGLRAQQSTLVNRIQAIGENNPGVGALKAVLADVRAQLADITGRIEDVGITDFNQQNSEDQARNQGQLQRAGTRGGALTLRGLTVGDSRVQANYAQQRQLSLTESARLQGLADDRSNSLSPEEREDYHSRALQLRVQATVGQASEIEQRRLGEQAAAGQVRQSAIGRKEAVAETAGGAGDIYKTSLEAANELLRRRGELQGELNRMERENVGTAGQRAQIQSQINDLTASAVRNTQAARYALYQGVGAEQEGAAGAAGAIARRMTFAGGTTKASYGASSVSLDAERAHLDTLRQAAEDPSLKPSDREQRQQAYQEYAAKLDADAVGKFGTFEEDPAERRRRTALEGAARRMAISPFVPGNRLGIASRLVRLDRQKLSGIDAQIRRVQSDPKLSDDQKANILASLEGQKEDTRTSITEQSAGVAEQMFSDRIAQSIGAPSFASRILPSASDVAGLAERKGLGAVSARVFGFRKASTYRDTMQYGLTAPDDGDMKLFGKRPGDLDGGLTEFGRGEGGGKVSDGSTPALTGVLASLTGVLATLAGGLKVELVTTNPDTGVRTAQTVNALKNGDSRAIQRGGAAQGPRY